MKKLPPSIIGILCAGLVVILLIATSSPTFPVSADEPTPWPYTAYIPLVAKEMLAELPTVYPADWCSCTLYQRVAGVEDGIRCTCASDSGTKAEFYAGTGRFPSPYGSYGTYAGRTFLLFPESAGGETPVLRVFRVLASGINTSRCLVDVHVFSLPEPWDTPLKISDEMWKMVGPRLGGAVVDIIPEESNLAIPLSGFSRAIVVLSRCEFQHELCATNPYEYSWSLTGSGISLDW